MTLMHEDKEFYTSIERIIQSSITNFEEHYIKYGGKSGLFAYCLLLSLDTDENSDLFRAKASLLNWYAEERKIGRTRINGGGVKAWWPFEWFSSNFDAIAASVIASLIFSASGALISRIRKAFQTSFEPVRNACNPYPQSVLRGKSPHQTMEDFDNSLQASGLIDQFLFIFKLTHEEIEKLIEDWTKAFIHFKNTLTSTETNFIIELLDGPVTWSESSKGANGLRDRQVVKLVEPNPNEFWFSLYPRIFEDEK